MTVEIEDIRLNNKTIILSKNLALGKTPHNVTFYQDGSAEVNSIYMSASFNADLKPLKVISTLHEESEAERNAWWLLKQAAESIVLNDPAKGSKEVISSTDRTKLIERVNNAISYSGFGAMVLGSGSSR